MNLGELIDGVRRALRHGPNVRTERDEVVDRLNRKLTRLTVERSWSWRQRLANLRLKADVTDTPITSPGTYGTYAIGIPLPSTWNSTTDPPLVAGATVTIDTSGPWVVERAIYDGALAADRRLVLFLDPTYPGGVSGTSMTLSFPRYRLPGDLGDQYAFMLRDDDAGPLREITLDQETDLMLNGDDSPSTPGCFILDPNRPRELWDPAANYPHFYAEPPHAPFTGASNASSGVLTPADVYEYRYAWVYGGMISGFSETVQVTVGAGHTRIELSGLEVIGDATNPYGRRKYLFRRQVRSDRLDPWYKIDEIAAETSSYTDAGAFNPLAIASSSREREWPAGGVTRWVRFYPVTDQDRVVELRYLAKARPMEGDADEPDLPEFAHEILVHAVVEEMAAEADGPDLARHHREQYKDLHRILSRRELASAATVHQRGRIDQPTGRPGLRFGRAVWNG